MSRSSSTFVAVALAALACAPTAWADDDSDSGAGEAIGFSGTLGLAGFQDMVDARTPKGLMIRGGVRYSFELFDHDYRGAVKFTRERARHEMSFYAGVSLLDLVDVAARIPYVWQRDTTNFVGAIRDTSDADNGWGDLDLAAKISLELGPVDIAPFVFGRFPTGEPAVKDLAEGEYGVAATFSVLNEYLSAHGNISGIHRDGGLSGFRYRLGAAFVVLATDIAMVRVYAYGDGLQFDGNAESFFDAEFGVQARILEFITVEVGASIRVLDAEELDHAYGKELLKSGVIPQKSYDDDGTWGVTAGVGFLF